VPDALVNHAMRYAEWGYPVFPVRWRGKIPATTHGCLDATVKPDAVRHFWNGHRLNIGVATTDCVVIDVDRPLADDAGHEWLRKHRAELERSAGAISLTPRGGRHYWYAQPRDRRIQNSASKLAPGIDVRGTGGYVVAPPSTGTSGVYTWIEDRSLSATPLPLLPEWLLHELTDAPRSYEPVALPPRVRDGGLATPSPNVPIGRRNAYLATVAGRLRRYGCSAAEIAAVLELRNRERCSPALDAQEVAAISASMERYAPAARPHAEDIIRLAVQSPTPLPAEPVIEGLLRRGEVGNFIAPPKTGKSWAVLDLALAAISGGLWWGRFACHARRVLILDWEMPVMLLAARLPVAAALRGIALAGHDDSLYVLPLRGSGVGLEAVRELCTAGEIPAADLIIVDPLYRTYGPGLDENSNAAIAGLYGELDQLVRATNAAMMIVHHAAKGGRGSKALTDVGAGAGSQSRAADTHIILTPDRGGSRAILEAAARSWPPIAPVHLEWRPPFWAPYDQVPPLQGANPTGMTAAEFVTRYVRPGSTQAAIRAQARGVLSWRGTAQMIEAAEAAHLIERRTDSRRGHAVLFYPVGDCPE